MKHKSDNIFFHLFRDLPGEKLPGLAKQSVSPGDECTYISRVVTIFHRRLTESISRYCLSIRFLSDGLGATGDDLKNVRVMTVIYRTLTKFTSPSVSSFGKMTWQYPGPSTLILQTSASDDRTELGVFLVRTTFFSRLRISFL